jgi:hypothetical protein
VRQYAAEDNNKLIATFGDIFAFILSQNFSFDVRTVPGNLSTGCGISTTVPYHPCC